MLDIKKHFLESNIVIGLSVEWDNQNSICSSYKKEASDNHWFSSKKVIEYEVEPIINGLRQNLETLIHDVEISSTPDVESLKSKVWDLIPDINEEKHEKITRYIDHNHSEFEKFVTGEKGADEMLLLVNSDFDEPVKYIYGIKNRTKPIMYLDYNPHEHINNHRKTYSTVKRKINHEDDTEVLLDAHHFSVKENGKVAFITTDKEHIIDNSDEIESALEDVEIFNPHNEL